MTRCRTTLLSQLARVSGSSDFREFWLGELNSEEEPCEEVGLSQNTAFGKKSSTRELECRNDDYENKAPLMAEHKHQVIVFKD